MTELQLIYDHLDKACCPEDVFGSGDNPLAVYRKLVQTCHPDLHEDALATAAFQKLNALKDEAKKRIDAGDYGKRIPLLHCTPLEIGKYKVNRKPIIGDIADVYRVEGIARVVKVARNHDDNDLMRAEASALKRFDDIKGPVRDGVPILTESFRLDGVRKREVNVLADFPGFVTAQEVHSKMAVDARTAVWMFKRILSLLTWVHHFGLIHGAILPSHVLFYPDNDGNKGVDPRKHSVRLIDWCYSVDFKNRTRLSSWVPAWKDHYAPELIAKTSIGPSSDIFMAAKLMVYLDQKQDLAGPLFDDVLKKCLQKDPAKRYQDAGEVLKVWTEAATKVFGYPKWHEFVV